MRRLTIQRTTEIILFLLLFALAARIPTDTDTWWHLRSAEHILSEGFIYADPFSWTMQGQPWVNHSWGAQLILYAFWQLGGNLGLTVYMAGLATAGMYLVYRMGSGNVYLKAFVLVVGAATAAVFWSPRPQMLSFFLSALVLYLLDRYRREHVDRLWLIPIIMLVWGNLHAGFSIGFIFLLGIIAGEVLNLIFNPAADRGAGWQRVRRLLLITLVSVGTLVVNPYGIAIYRVPFETVNIGALQNFIQEWNSPNFHERQTWPFIALLLGVLGAAGASPRKLDWPEFVLVAGTAFMALLAGRNIAVFAVVATPVLMRLLDAALTERGWALPARRFATPMQARLNLLLVVLVAVGALAKVLLVLDPETVAQAQSEFLPVSAAAYLNAEQPTGPMFNSYNWGGYLMFAAPAYPVYVDGRTDLYGDAFLTDQLNIARGGEGWRESLDRQGVNLVVVEAYSGLAQRLSEDPAWQLDYQDERAVAYRRQETPDVAG